MNKSERINDMLIYLNEKNYFNLKNLMEKYNISKSTALRDIETLERLGMPIYSQMGRNGYYGLLRNRLLSPVLFNTDEMLSLYFSMITLRAYESTPFHMNIENLVKKFEKCLPAEKIESLHKIENVFSLATLKHNNSCEFLDIILQFAIEEKVTLIKYKKNNLDVQYIVQFFNITSAYGQWYVTGFNFEKKHPIVLRCDKILSAEESNLFPSKKLNDLLKMGNQIYKSEHAIEFEVQITEKATDLFYKEHYPSMKLYCENNQHSIKGFYNIGEEEFIAKYFITYGESIQSIYPKSLKILVLKKINSLKEHISNI